MDVAHFFRTMPKAMPLYEVVKDNILSNFEDVAVKIQKSQISFVSNKSFAYVWLPIRKMKNRPENYIILTFGLSYHIQSLRIVETVEPYPNRWTCHVIIQDPSEIDDEIIGWLRQAYIFVKRSDNM